LSYLFNLLIYVPISFFTVQGIVVFKIYDTDEVFTLDLKGPNFSVTKGETENADLTVIVESENMTKLITGALKPQQAFMKGKLKIKGKMNLAMKLTAVLAATRKKMPKANL
jgi:putative sterol carrier protein